MRVFRVEIYNAGDVGQGVYRANILTGFARATSPLPSQDNKLRSVWDNMNYELRRNYYFAFESLESVNRWFTREELTCCMLHCALVEYEVSEYYIGTCQVVFDVRTAVQIGVVDSALYM